MSTTVHVLLGYKKPRLYVVLYALEGALRDSSSTGPPDYHWAFIVAPKDAPKDQKCIRYRIKKFEEREQLDPHKGDLKMVVWDYENCFVPFGRHDDIVARVLIAKLEDSEAVEEHMQLAWPEKTMHMRKSGKARTSKDWAQRVLEGLGGFSRSSGGVKYMVSGKVADWTTIEACCTTFANKVVVGGASLEAVPTFDLLKNQEVFEYF
ncbi:MAG: hypothetical protein ASARMPREDX12_000508 [Alectoria sarmentosa]|nr:MAG: hypothetical protein ASARMPREDX12_000508 [Alectoria sarmentosa]